MDGEKTAGPSTMLNTGAEPLEHYGREHEHEYASGPEKEMGGDGKDGG